MRIRQVLAGIALAAVMNVAYATNLFVGVDPATGETRFFIGSGAGSVTRGNAPDSGMTPAPQQMQIFLGTEAPARGEVTTIGLDTFIQNVDAGVIEAIIKNKAAIDQENAASVAKMQAQMHAGSGGAEQKDLDRVKSNLDNLVGNIVKKAIEQGKVDPDRIRALIDQVNQGLVKKIDLANTKPLELSEQEKARQAHIKLLEEERKKKQEAEKTRQEQLKKQNEALQAKLKEQLEKQKAEKEKAAEAAKKKAAEEHAKKLSDQAAKEAFETKQTALAEEKRKQAAQVDKARAEAGPPPINRGTQGSGGESGNETGGSAGGDGGNADRAGQGGDGGAGGQSALTGRGGDGGAGGDGGRGSDDGLLLGSGGDDGDGGLAGRGGDGGAGGDGGRGGDGGLLLGSGGDGGAGGQAGPSNVTGGDGGQAGQGGAGGDGGQGGLLAGHGGDGGTGGQAGQGDPASDNRYDPNAPVDSGTLRRLVNGSPLPPITPLSLADALRQAMAGRPEESNVPSNGDSAADEASQDQLLRDFVESAAAASDYPYIAAGDVSALPPTESLRGELSASYNGRLSGAFGDGTAVGGTMSLNVAFDDYAFTGDIVFDGGNGKAGVTGGWDAGVNSVGGSIYSPEPVYGGEVSGSLAGKFYGPKGQELGGDWSMEVLSGVRTGQSAGGNFATKQ